MRFLVRADASTAIGSGHVMRCLALAASITANQDKVYFASSPLSPFVAERLEREGIEMISFEPQPHGLLSQEAEKVAAAAKSFKATWVILDGYHFTTEYQKILKHAGLSVLSIDDIADCYYESDIVVNQNLDAETVFSYRCNSSTKLLLGADYILLRPEFRAMSRRKPSRADLRNILVFLGGGDPENTTLKALEGLSRCHQDLHIKAVIGSYNPHQESIRSFAGSMKQRIEILNAVEEVNELMAWSDLALCAAGSVSWELAYLGIPMVTGVIAENQRPIAARLVERGAAVSVGDWQQASPHSIAVIVSDLCNDSERRSQLAGNALALCDGAGCDRVYAAMREISRQRGSL